MIEFASEIGLQLMEWQKFVCIHGHKVRPDGRWAHSELGLIMARQQGKSTLMMLRILTGMYVWGEGLQLASAHRLTTSLETFRADDALEEAATGLRDGFSVGVKINEWKNVEGVLRIQSSSLQEVSLVTDPAIDSARVAEVAASATPENSEATAEETTTQEDKVSDTTSEAPIATEAVEASQAPVVTAQYMAYTKPRIDTNVTAGQYLNAQIKALSGDTDARDLVAALQIATVSENTGTVPPNYLRDVIGVIDSSRPFIDSIERAPLPASGMKVFTPKLGAQAIVGQTAEGVEFASQDTAVTFQEDTIVKFAGANIVNVELFDRSDPSFADLLVRELAASYAQKTDAYAATIAADGADTLSMLNLMLDATSFKNTAQTISSNAINEA